MTINNININNKKINKEYNNDDDVIFSGDNDDNDYTEDYIKYDYEFYQPENIKSQNILIFDYINSFGVAFKNSNDDDYNDYDRFQHCSKDELKLFNNYFIISNN